MNINRIVDWVHRYRRILIVLMHLVFVAAAYFLAFFLRFELNLPAEYRALILTTILFVIVTKMIVFYYFGLYHGLWRYVSVDDLWQIIRANVIASIVVLIVIVFQHGLVGYPRSVFIIDWMFSIALIGGSRFITRSLREKIKRDMPPKNQKNLLIIGAGEAGILVCKEYRRNPGISAAIVGFIDDDPLKRNQTIHGVKVLGNRGDIPWVVKTYQVDEVLLAIPSANGETVRRILSHCRIPNLKIKIVPGLDKIFDGTLEVKPRDVRPEDLLGRETVTIKEDQIKMYLKGKRVLVTGAGGSIGSALARLIAAFGPKQLILLDHNENNVYFLSVSLKTTYPGLDLRTIIGDIKDIGMLKHTFSLLRPQVIFHAAAHKHVPLMEENPAAAVKNNVIGSRNIIYAASHYGAERFVLISTDKAVNPTSIMGATKRIAEMILQAKARYSRTKYMAVRFGNVLGSDGSVIPLFKKQIEEGGPVTVTHPETRRYFMSAKEAAELVLQAGAMGKSGEIFILDMGEQIKIADLAQNLIILSGLEPGRDISIKYIGLRPGEKLYEEMFLEVEKNTTTAHNKIYVVQPNDFNPAVLRGKVKELERLAVLMDNRRIINGITELVPSYGKRA